MKNLNSLGAHWKIWLLGGRGEFTKTSIEGELSKKGRGLGKKKGVVFLRGEGWYPNAHYDQQASTSSEL